MSRIFRRNFAIVVLLCFSADAFSQDSLTIAREYLESGYKNFAFCRCLYSSNSKDSTIVKEFVSNDGSAAGYFDVVDIGLEHSIMLDSLARKYSRKYYPSKYDNPLLLMKCLDFYNSAELKDSINSILNRYKEYYSESDQLEYFYKRAMFRKEHMK